MLYTKSELMEDEEKKFLFDVESYNEDIDVRLIAAIQSFYEKNGYIPEEHIPDLLNWMIYRARINISYPLESPLTSDFAIRCAVAQSFFEQILEKMGFERLLFNVGEVLGTTPIHALTCVQIPTKQNGVDSSKFFMLDPTFKQFCRADENRFELYFEKSRGGVRKSNPRPGYFFNLTSQGQEFAKHLIRYGYFEITDDSLKTYFDPFKLFITPKEEYKEPDDIGRISSTDKDGAYYWNRMMESREKAFHGSRDFNLDTPIEIVAKEERKLRNIIRRTFYKKELNDMFVVDDVLGNNNNNNKIAK